MWDEHGHGRPAPSVSIFCSPQEHWSGHGRATVPVPHGYKEAHPLTWGRVTHTLLSDHVGVPRGLCEIKVKFVAILLAMRKFSTGKATIDTFDDDFFTDG
jgi:hypothetical protein